MVQIERGGGMNKYQEALDYLVGELKGCDEAISDFEYQQELNAKREAAEKLLQELIYDVTIRNFPKNGLCECGESLIFSFYAFCPQCGKVFD